MKVGRRAAGKSLTSKVQSKSKTIVKKLRLIDEIKIGVQKVYGKKKSVSERLVIGILVGMALRAVRV